MANMSGSKAEFRSAIQQQLQTNGVLDEITASVRSRILQSLLHGPTASAPRKETNSQSTALLSLLYHFLEQNQFTHTLSVFAAESKMERSLPLSLTDAIKELGLQDIWDKLNKTNQFLTIDILSSLQGVAHMVSMQQENIIKTDTIKVVENSDRVQTSKAIQTDVESPPRTQASKSIQTDAESMPRTFSDLENNNDNRSGYCNESSILAIERECQQRMRQEMNEKLRMSAKTQAIQATRRLEQKHKEALQLLHHQIEVERGQSQRRQDELTEKLTQQQAMAQHEQGKITQRLDAILLEKSSLQSEMDLLNERVKEMQKQRFKEWSNEHEMLQRKSRDSMNELDGEKRNLQAKLHEIDMQKEAMRAKEAHLASLTQEKSVLLAEIADLRLQQTSSLGTQKRTQFEFQTQLAAMQEKYFATKADLHTSRDEVVGLLALLKQSQKAIESISFREIGAVNIFSPPNIYNRSAMRRPASQLGSRAQPKPGAKVVSFAHPTASCETGNIDSLSPPALQNELKEKPQNLDQVNTNPKPHMNESAPTQILLNRTRCAHSAIDPPCCSSEDPPEAELHLDVRWGKSHHKKVVRNHEEHADVDNSIDTIVGKEIVLNLSSITENVQQEDLIALTSMPSMVQVGLPAEATNLDTSLLDQSCFDGPGINVANVAAVENIVQSTKKDDVPLPESLHPSAPDRREITVANVGAVENIVQDTKKDDVPLLESLPPNAPEHSSNEAHLSLGSSNEKADHEITNYAQQSTALDVVSTSLSDADQYSERFQSFDEEICQPLLAFQGNAHASPEQTVRNRDNVPENDSNQGSPGSLSSDGYSESFCS